MSIVQICAQQYNAISTIDFVEVLNNNKGESLYYYKNNWQQLRIKAIEKGYIESYDLLQTEPNDKTPYQFILITTYSNKKQYDESEERFQELIKQSGGLKLLNDKKPPEFRNVLFSNNLVKHLN